MTVTSIPTGRISTATVFQGGIDPDTILPLDSISEINNNAFPPRDSVAIPETSAISASSRELTPSTERHMPLAAMPT